MPTDSSLTQNQPRHGVIDPALQGDERTTVLAFLQRQRELVIWKAQDVTESQSRPVSTPTGMTAHGVIQHLTDVERYWFRQVFDAEAGLSFHYSDSDPDGDWVVPLDITMRDLLMSYADEAARCDAVIAAADLGAVARTPTMPYSLRWIVVHMIEETARHLGHLDLLRERIDGVVGEEPDAEHPTVLVTVRPAEDGSSDPG